MHHIAIVDHPLFAEGLSLFLRKWATGQVVTTTTDPSEIAPPNSLVLIEVFLPENQCGLQLAAQLRQLRPDLTSIVWTTHPSPLHIWAGMEYKVLGVLDKCMPSRELLYWLKHAAHNGAAWSGGLLDRVRHWEYQVAQRLRELTPELWLLWGELLCEKDVSDIVVEQGWARRTVERKMSELYSILSVRSRPHAVGLAWKLNLVTLHGGRPHWAPIVVDIFINGSSGSSSRDRSIHNSQLSVRA